MTVILSSHRRSLLQEALLPGSNPRLHSAVGFTRLRLTVVLPNSCLNVLMKDLSENKIFSLVNQECPRIFIYAYSTTSGFKVRD